MATYNDIRIGYKPDHIKVLMIAESPPPAANVQSSRQFYYTDRIRKDDRLFTNTVKALYPEAANLTEPELQEHKKDWLKKFQAGGWYMIEALESSLAHEVTKKERQALIRTTLPQLLERVKKLVKPGTKIILIKSNVFDVAAEPLRAAGYNVLNAGLLDYPGRYNQRDYREKLKGLNRKYSG